MKQSTLIIIIILAVVVLGGGGVAVYFLTKKKNQPAIPATDGGKTQGSGVKLPITDTTLTRRIEALLTPSEMKQLQNKMLNILKWRKYAVAKGDNEKWASAVKSDLSLVSAAFWELQKNNGWTQAKKIELDNALLLEQY